MRLLVLAIVVAGCSDELPAYDVGTSCEATIRLQERQPAREIDLVIVVSDSLRMASSRERLAEGLRRFPWALGDASLQVAFVTPDGRFVDPIIEDVDLPWFWCGGDTAVDCRARNFDGALGDELARVGAIEATRAGPSPLLARLDEALGSAPLALRPRALVAVILISPDDDASPGDPAGYLARLRDRQDVYVGAIAPEAAPRLDALLAAFPNRSGRVAIDSASWEDVLVGVGCGLLCGPRVGDCLTEAHELSTCVAADVDPVTGRERDLPPCAMAAPDRPDPSTVLPCVWFREIVDEPACEHVGVVEREHDEPSAVAHVRCECATRTPAP